jgi:hypothetical protein
MSKQSGGGKCVLVHHEQTVRTPCLAVAVHYEQTVRTPCLAVPACSEALVRLKKFPLGVAAQVGFESRS